VTSGHVLQARDQSRVGRLRLRELPWRRFPGRVLSDRRHGGRICGYDGV